MNGGKSHRSGSTLVEMLVVITIIAILLSFILSAAMGLYRAVQHLAHP